MKGWRGYERVVEAYAFDCRIRLRFAASLKLALRSPRRAHELPPGTPNQPRARHGGTKGETNCCVHSGIPFLGWGNTMKGLATPIGIQTSTSVVAGQAEILAPLLALRSSGRTHELPLETPNQPRQGWGAATRKGKQTVVFSQGHYF